MYILQNGKDATKEEIEAAVSSGMAVIAHASGHRKVSRTLRLDGESYDTRGKGNNFFEECWTEKCGSVDEALAVAHYIKSF